MGCNCCEEPYASFNTAFESRIGGGIGPGSGTTAAGAWANAVADIPAYTGTFSFVSGFPGSVGTFNEIRRFTSSSFAADAARIKYKWVFLIATCYFKIWWDEVTSHYNGVTGGGSPAPVSTTPFEWEWTVPSEDGLCLPVGFDIDDTDTWPQSPVYEITEQMPADPAADNHSDIIQIDVQNVRYTWVDGYTPTDLADSGFPPE